MIYDQACRGRAQLHSVPSHSNPPSVIAGSMSNVSDLIGLILYQTISPPLECGTVPKFQNLQTNAEVLEATKQWSHFVESNRQKMLIQSRIIFFMTDKVNFLHADWLVEYRLDPKFNSHSRAKYEPFHYRGGHTGQDGVMVLYINVAGGQWTI